MKRVAPNCLAALIAVAQAACIPDPTGPDQPSESCPGDRWVGVINPGGRRCEDLRASDSRWQVSTLFSRTEAGAEEQLPAGLARFCLVEWTGTDPPPATQPVFPGGVVTQLARDCRVVAPLASYETLADHPDVTKRLTDTFTTQAGVVGGPVPGKPVRVAVVDTSKNDLPSSNPDGRAGSGRSGHGTAIGRAIRVLTCPSDTDEPACIGRISNHLALPLLNAAGARDAVNGGYYGSQVDLARAIHRALVVWRQSGEEAKQVPLVVNLSVGWDAGRQYGGELDLQQSGSDLLGPVQSVYAAIERVACHGGLVIAAAGNRTGGDDAISTVGPMFPAAWEAVAAPSLELCRARYGVAVNVDPRLTPAYQPLLYAAGGVDGQDNTLFLSRTSGRPRLAAHSFQVTVDDTATGGHTDVLTGTSISAAVTSAAAAMVWGQFPTLARADVMNLVYAGTAQPVADDVAPLHADFCLGGTMCAAFPIGRVSVCGALERACNALGCGTPPPPCRTPPPHAGINAAWPREQWDAIVSDVANITAPVGAAAECPPGPPCSPDLVKITNAGKPVVGPQPDEDGCDGACDFVYGSGIGYGYWPVRVGRPIVMPRERSLAELAAEAEMRARAGAAGKRGLALGPVNADPPTDGALYMSLPVGFVWSKAQLTFEDQTAVRTFDVMPLLKSPPPQLAGDIRTYVITGFTVAAPPVKRARISFEHDGVKSTISELGVFFAPPPEGQ